MAAIATGVAGHIAADVLRPSAKPPDSVVPAWEEPHSHGATEVHNHKTIEPEIKEERKEYTTKRAARAPINELIQVLERMMEDTQG